MSATAMRALIVDDSKSMRMILGNYLRKLGFDVTEAAEGREALAALRRMGQTDIALVDVNMPVMNGIDFVRAVRSEPVFSNIRLLMVTSELELSQMSRALQEGANEYLMKPFTCDALHKKLEILGLCRA